MDVVESPQTQPEPVAYSSPSFPTKLLIMGVILIAIALSFAGGYFFSQMNNAKNQPSLVSTNLNKKAVISQPTEATNASFPIDPTSSAVKSLWVLYSLSGVVDSINQVNIENTSGYNIQISSPTGPLVNQTFFVSDQLLSIVSLDKTGKETKLDIAALKKGDSVQISYQVDVKIPGQAQVTKLAILK